jgi:hypothetical protein
LTEEKTERQTLIPKDQAWCHLEHIAAAAADDDNIFIKD